MNASFRPVHAVPLVLAALMSMRCDSPRTPRAPTQPTPTITVPQPAAQPAFVLSEIRGSVTDTALLPLPEARVVVVSGAETAGPVVADSVGVFRIPSPRVIGDVTFRVTKDGYAPAEVVVTYTKLLIQREQPHGGFMSPISLVSDAPELVFEPGRYVLTVETDAFCTAVPAELRQQRFEATLDKDGAHAYVLNALGPFERFLDSFYIRVAGGTVATVEENGLYWHASPSQCFEVWTGRTICSHTLGAALTVSSASFPVHLEYSDVKSDVGQQSNCFNSSAYATCPARLTVSK